MTWMLDSNACIRYMNGRAPVLKQRIDAADPTELCVCSVVKGELYYGSARSNDPVQSLAKQKRFLSPFTSLSFDDAAAEVYGQIRAALMAMGQPIGGNDMLIAAIAVTNRVTLVTRNTKEFSRVAGLRIEDWEV
jgi:tRNA(fMet)-specific endonuclease VapC